VRKKKKKKKRSSLNFGWKIRKIEPSWESSSGILGKFIRKIGREILRLGKSCQTILGKLRVRPKKKRKKKIYRMNKTD
jgi:hypothetical protein